MKTFLLVFVLGHLIGDFVFQTNKIAALKSRGLRGIGLHVTILTLTQCLLLALFYGFRGFLAGLIVGILHFFVDYMKKQLNPYIKSHQSAYFIFDQGIHILIIYVVTRLMYSDQALLTLDGQWLLFAIGMILTYYVGTVLVKFVLIDLDRLQKGRPFFEKNERLSDGITGLIIFTLFSYSIWGGIASVVLLVALYVVLQKKLFMYESSVIRIKYLVIILVAYGSTLIGHL